jgi:hypothetical protein
MTRLERTPRGRWLERIDALLWFGGAALALAAVIDGLRSGRSLSSLLPGTCLYSAGSLLVLAALVLVIIVLRSRGSR